MSVNAKNWQELKKPNALLGRSLFLPGFNVRVHGGSKRLFSFT